MFEEIDDYKKKAAQYIFVFFGVIVLVISAITSFSFFYTFFGNLLPDGFVENSISRMVSGVIGTVLFDLATAVWLFVFLQASNSPEQRAISGIMTLVVFVGAASSSVAYLILTATGQLALDAGTQDSVATFALVVVIIGVIANFGAAQAHRALSTENKEAITLSNWRDKLAKNKQKNKKGLMRQVEAQVKEQLKIISPDLAKIKTQLLVQEFLETEGGEELLEKIDWDKLSELTSKESKTPQIANGGATPTTLPADQNKGDTGGF